MAKKPRANNQNNTMRSVIIIFSAFVLIASALLIWNNRSLSFAGTIDGERVPMPYFNFMWNNWMERMMWEFQMPNDEESRDLANMMAWDDLVDQTLVVNQAAERGISLTDEDRARAAEIAENMRAAQTFDDGFGNTFDGIREMGFTNASFRRFTERMVLHDLVYTDVTAVIQPSEEELAQALADYMTEHFLDFRSVFIHLIEVQTQEQAQGFFAQVATGADFAEIMREYSLAYNPELLSVDEDGELIEAVHIHATNLAHSPEHLEMAHAMEVGSISDIIELINGHFAFFEVVNIEDTLPEDIEDDFNEFHIENLRNEYFRNSIVIWREHAEISQNRRLFN
ncbi:MAG: SurA N-terminal domain-containing protein [Defluviitaleaceae bacterium]|nr:SurA N-terminal domain-containing protein [Defluviitaleaceae bacterium]